MFVFIEGNRRRPTTRSTIRFNSNSNNYNCSWVSKRYNYARCKLKENDVYLVVWSSFLDNKKSWTKSTKFSSRFYFSFFQNKISFIGISTWTSASTTSTTKIWKCKYLKPTPIDKNSKIFLFNQRIVMIFNHNVLNVLIIIV
jgi:hypothetical protein